MTGAVLLTPLVPDNVDTAYDFLERMIPRNRGLYHRPKAAMVRAAVNPDRGLLSYVDNKLGGFTALYDTPFPELVESGSTCIDNALQGLRLGPLILAATLINFYGHPENAGVTIIGDVLQSSVASKKMVDALGFTVIEAPAWYDAAHRARATDEQLKEPYYCVTIDRHAVLQLHTQYPVLPIGRHAA